MLQGVKGRASVSGGGPILVIDDDPDQRSCLAELLSCRGYDVVVACDGQEALELLDAGLCPSLIVLDLTMPRMDGWSFLERLRDCHSPVRVLITSAVVPGRPPPGAAACLEKPLDAAVFSSVVARLFDEARLGIQPR